MKKHRKLGKDFNFHGAEDGSKKDVIEDSEANGEISDADAEKGVGKRVAIAELITELRHKYITILKMHYIDNYSQG